MELSLVFIVRLLLLPIFVYSIGGVKLDPFEEDCLEAHNTYRAEHGVPPLAWSAELAERAQNWADELASNDELKHDTVATEKDDEGENLAFFRPAVPKCQGLMVGNCVFCREMVKRWYDEVKNYDFDSGTAKNPNEVYKHFSQLIWANTSEVGIGTSVSKKYGFVTVARYKPQGNKGGPAVFMQNVPPEGGPLPSLTSSTDPNFHDKPSTTSNSTDPTSTGASSSSSAASTTPTGLGVPVTKKTSGPSVLNILPTPKEQSSHTPVVNLPKTNEPPVVKVEKISPLVMFTENPHKSSNKVGAPPQNGSAKARLSKELKVFAAMLMQQRKQNEKNIEESSNNDSREDDSASNIQNGNSYEDGREMKSDNTNNDFSYENSDQFVDNTLTGERKISFSNKSGGKHAGQNGDKNSKENGKDEGNNNSKNSSEQKKNEPSKIANGSGSSKSTSSTSDNTSSDHNNKSVESSSTDNISNTSNKSNGDKKSNNGSTDNKSDNNNNTDSINDKNSNHNNKNNIKDTNSDKDNKKGIHSYNEHNNDNGSREGSINRGSSNEGLLGLDKGLIRTVKGPGGDDAQVYLTKDGAHAGIVFRDHISRVTADEIQKNAVKRTIYVL